jgi:hypothetical protein
MYLKPLVMAGALVFAVSAFAQQAPQPRSNSDHQQQPQTPANGQTNAQGEKPAGDRTMQEKDTGLMNQSGGAPGATGSTGTQSGTQSVTPPNSGSAK